MMHHFLDTGDSGYCDCGRWVRAVCVGFGPQTSFIYLDSDDSERCD